MGGTKRLELAVEAGNILNNAVFANPQNNITSGTFGQITGMPAARHYPDAAVSPGLRFSSRATDHYRIGSTEYDTESPVAAMRRGFFCARRIGEASSCDLMVSRTGL